MTEAYLAGLGARALVDAKQQAFRVNIFAQLSHPTGEVFAWLECVVEVECLVDRDNLCGPLHGHPAVVQVQVGVCERKHRRAPRQSARAAVNSLSQGGLRSGGTHTRRPSSPWRPSHPQHCESSPR
jgi:hypothetical protein